MSLSMYRCIASYFQTAVDSTQAGSLLVPIYLLFGGFVLPRPFMPQWLKWGFWVSPLAYTEIGLAVNEFLAPRWQKMQSSNVTIGTQMLISRGLNYAGYYFWIGVGALIGFILLFNLAFTLALTFKRLSYHSQLMELREGLYLVKIFINFKAIIRWSIHQQLNNIRRPGRWCCLLYPSLYHFRI